jgi:phosphoglycolate phosphatase-like HAD superfamily hydrolase
LARLLALDFDGVLSDSAPESFWVALWTYAELLPETRWAGPWLRDVARAAPPLDTIAADPRYRAFVDLMPLGNRAEDFSVCLRAIERGEGLKDQADYDAFRATVDPEWLRDFHERFYRNRDALREHDPRGWRALMGPYPELLTILRRHRDDTILAIATAKDRRSVRWLLDDYGIADLFSEDRLLDKEVGEHKDVHLRALRERFSVPFAEMVFVDDKVNHLDRVAPLGVECALAGWGYNGRREAELARSRGYCVLQLADVESRLFA